MADLDIVVGLARVLDPERLVRSPVAPRHRPGTSQCMVDGRDLVVEQMVWIGLVEVDPFLDGRLVVAVQGQAAAVERAWSPHPARLDQKCFVSNVSVLIDPLADRITVERRRQSFRPGTPVGVDPTMRNELNTAEIPSLKQIENDRIIEKKNTYFLEKLNETSFRENFHKNQLKKF